MRRMFPKDTVRERLSDSRFAKKLQHDYWAWSRERVDLIYGRLVRIGLGPGPTKSTKYRGTRGSGMNADRRARILARVLDLRHIRR